ncbi:hypothetical protein H072_10200 [Dactylellina haptotyla CBS 200.50]|uniref:MIF4G domain-containing protein n=1 Tax=Dactylellina haptotyla (strain CBS 200.50) TaxID=1284197 RepID=S8BB14_DACHA|nr:hypothetical protein H072_10200 [Dactylellina haptotyla CBS 200.50]
MSSTTDTRSRKRELRKLNQQIWEGRTDVFAVKPPLDTSFKKNTAVIKKFRTSLTPDNTTSLLKDIATVSLEKYLPEVISAVSEGLLKAKVAGDINTAVEVVSALHQRFSKAFTPFIVWNIAKGLSTPGKEQLRSLPADQREKEEASRLTRQRILLRVATELWLVGVVRTLDDAINPDDNTTTTAGSKSSDNAKKQIATTIAKTGDDEPLPLEALKDILSRDREGVNLSLVVLFIKNFAWDVLGVKARATSRKAGEDPAQPAESETVANGTNDPMDQPLTETTVQTRYRNILTTYFTGVSKYIQNEHRRLQQQAKRNSEAYVRSGEVFEDRQQAFEKATKTHEKLIANAQIVSEALGLEMPDLSDEDEAKESGEGMIRETGSMFKKGDEAAGNGMWEDEDQRRFYEDLIDLRARVPSILLDEGRKATSASDKKDEDGAKADVPDEELAVKTGDIDLNADSAERDTTIANKTVGAQVDALLIRLPELTNRDLIDSFAYDFCFLNSKASRNRLIKVLEDIPKGRSDLLPYYARLIASLSKAGLTDITSAMVTYLDKEFRSLQKRKEKEQLTAVRTQNAKYFSEMTKFGLVPEHVIFHCFKVALDDFSKMNIDIICILLEGCGRYLLRTSATQPRMITFLETLQRKKDAHHLSPQDRISIENAFYYVNPPERPSIVAKERSPSELYVRKLIYLDLNKKNYNKTIKSLRKLHWEDPDIVHMLVKVSTKIWKVRYSNVFLIAIVVFGLFRYHQDFGIRVVDGVLENIRAGLEENDYRMNQRRIATIKYLGELYNYKMIDSPVIFDTLYLILSFGYEGSPRPGMYNPLDPPDNHFRVRLVCTLLDTCGECFDRGSSRKKLDFFLAFFQYYIHLKERVPMDIEFMIQDTFQLVRPNWALHTSLEEAGKAFQEATSKIYGPAEAADDDSSTTEDAAGSDADDDEIKLSDDEMDIEAELPAGSNGNNGIHDANDDDEAGSDSDDGSSDSGDDDESIVYSRPQEYRDPEAEADFDREFAKLMAESLESRKFERKTVFDVPLPIKKSMITPTGIAPPPGVITMSMLEEEEEEVPPPPQPGRPGIMTFSLLTKRGNKQQTREIELPSDSTFAVAMKTKQEAEREERQRIKDRVLHYERMEEEPVPLEPQRPNTNGANLKYGDKNKTARGKKLQLGDFNWYDRNPKCEKNSQNQTPNPIKPQDEKTMMIPGSATVLSIQQKKERSENQEKPKDEIIVKGDTEALLAVNQRQATPVSSQNLQPNTAFQQKFGNLAIQNILQKSQTNQNYNKQKKNYQNTRENAGNEGGYNNGRKLMNNRGRAAGGANYTGHNQPARKYGNGGFQPHRHQQPQPQQRQYAQSCNGPRAGGGKDTENNRFAGTQPRPNRWNVKNFDAKKAAGKGFVPPPAPPPPPPAINDSNWPELGKM